MKIAYIITGGTTVPVTPHFSLTAPAYGTVGRRLCAELTHFNARVRKFDKIILIETKMACGGKTTLKDQGLDVNGLPEHIETHADLIAVIEYLVSDPSTKAIALPVAVCDWQPATLIQTTQTEIFEADKPPGKIDWQPQESSPGRLKGSGSFSLELTQFGPKVQRLRTDAGDTQLTLEPTDKIIGRIRTMRKDIFLIGFKATTGLNADEQYVRGLKLLKDNSCNLVFANDLHTRLNMVITPEEARYGQTEDRIASVIMLARLITYRACLTFTRSDVVDGDTIPWNSSAIPDNLRTVVNYCIAQGAYKPFQGKTVGHFATRGDRPGVIFTSRRKSNFNELHRTGLLRIEADGDDRVRAYGGKPSVGGQSQRIVFEQHPDVDCIVHFHCPLRMEYQDRINRRSQLPYECGSHECGANTSEGLQTLADFGDDIKVVMLENHGPNICFGREVDPQSVINLIDECFDLTAKTGGRVSLAVTA